MQFKPQSEKSASKLHERISKQLEADLENEFNKFKLKNSEKENASLVCATLLSRHIWIYDLSVMTLHILSENENQKRHIQLRFLNRSTEPKPIICFFILLSFGIHKLQPIIPELCTRAIIFSDQPIAIIFDLCTRAIIFSVQPIAIIFQRKWPYQFS